MSVELQFQAILEDTPDENGKRSSSNSGQGIVHGSCVVVLQDVQPI